VNREITIKLDGLKQDKFEITSQGFLMCDARVTRAGVFDYNEGRELRPPEEVFSEDSLKSLKMVPITRHHPDVMVTSSNVKQFQVGMVGENIIRDTTPEGDFVKCKVIITDKGEVERIIDEHKGGGDVELSCGYTSDVLDQKGEHPTEGKYDAVQTNIRYNHLSIVDRGRAGSHVKLKLDKKEKKDMKTFTKSPVKLDSFQMDAITGEVGEDSGLVVSALSSKLDEAVGVIKDHEQTISDAKKKVITVEEEGKKKEDELQGKIDGLETELKTAKEDADLSLDSPKVREMLDEYSKVTSAAMALEIPTSKKDDKDVEVPRTIRDLKVDIISKYSEDFKADDKSEEYISARFDTVMDMIKADVDKANKDKLGSFIAGATKTDGQKDYKKDFMEKSRDLHKTDNKE
jgi:hypothetical protein